MASTGKPPDKALRLLAALALSLYFLGCSSEQPCDIMFEKDTPSPDGRHVATVFEISCHDTTGNTPHVYLRRAGQKRGEMGNVLIGGPLDSFAVAWSSSESLIVDYCSDPQYRLSPATTNIDGVTITFKKRCPQ